MRALVVIPSLLLKYSFSAPLAWLFSSHVDRVRGIYSFEITKDAVKEHDLFIIELNWYVQLREFLLLVAFIKRHNKKAKILFGGLFSQLKYKELFRMCDADYFIRGDNEVPIQMLLDSKDPHTIPNMVGRDFENPVSYFFREEDFGSLDFNLDWFPSYLEYWHARPSEEPCQSYHLPVPPHGRYHLPTLLTARGGCTAQHPECGDCMAAQPGLMKRLYQRIPVVMSNEVLIGLLRKLEKRFRHASIIHIADRNYDFSGESFDLDCTVEIDWLYSVESVRRMLPAFRKSTWHLSLYKDGFAGGGFKLREDIDRCIELEDANHKIFFWGSRKDMEEMNIPEKNRLCFGDFFTKWTSYDYYSDMTNALRTSGNWYRFTRQLNLYPPHVRPFQAIANYAWITKFVFARLLGRVENEEFLNLA